LHSLPQLMVCEDTDSMPTLIKLRAVHAVWLLSTGSGASAQLATPPPPRSTELFTKSVYDFTLVSGDYTDCHSYIVSDEVSKSRFSSDSPFSGYNLVTSSHSFYGSCGLSEIEEQWYFPSHGNPPQWLPALYSSSSQNPPWPVFSEGPYWTYNAFPNTGSGIWGFGDYFTSEYFPQWPLIHETDRHFGTHISVRHTSWYAEERGIELVVTGTYYNWNPATREWLPAGSIPATAFTVAGKPLRCDGHLIITGTSGDIDVTPIAHIYNYYTYTVSAFPTKDVHLTRSYHPSLGTIPSVPERHGNFFTDFDGCKTEAEAAGDSIITELDGVPVQVEFHIYDSATLQFPSPYSNPNFNDIGTLATLTSLINADFANDKQVHSINVSTSEGTGMYGATSPTEPKSVLETRADARVWKHEIAHKLGVLNHRLDLNALMYPSYNSTNQNELNRAERAKMTLTP